MSNPHSPASTPSPAPDMDGPGVESGFEKVVQVSSALAVGTMTAFLYSLKSVNPTITLSVSFGTVVSFGIGCVVSWLFWKYSLRGLGSGDWKSIVLAAIAMTGIVLLGFGVAMRGLGRPRVLEMIEGTVLALVFVSGLGILLIRLVRFLEASDAQALKRDAEEE